MRSKLLIIGLLWIAGCQKQSPMSSKNVGELNDVLQHGKPEDKPAAALELSKRGNNASQSVPTLIEALQSDDPHLRQNAAMALGQIGPQASAAVDPLIAALSDSTWTVRRAAVIALGEIGDVRALEAVQKLARDPDSLVRKSAEQCIHRLNKANSRGP